ncbi:MAG TPA: hypothetical protein VEH06_08330 [Candidatus Bathyarchaeia archaeon]|nr:hypothetical protein [Candidatus Bathyarchaeia archaeon]
MLPEPDYRHLPAHVKDWQITTEKGTSFNPFEVINVRAPSRQGLSQKDILAGVEHFPRQYSSII